MISYNIEMQITDQVYSHIENNLKKKLNYEEY